MEKAEETVTESQTQDEEPEATAKEIAMAKMLEDMQNDYNKLKEELKKVKIDNETLSLKMGLRAPEEDPLRSYSKYGKER